MQVKLLKGRLTKSTKDAAGYDLHSTIDKLLVPGEVTVIPTGVVTEMEGCYGFIADRSGLAAKFGVTRRAGIIDEKYPGEWGVVMVNEGKEAYQIKIGDRIAQTLFMPIVDVNLIAESGGVNIKEVTRTEGFGSTGV